MPVSYAWQASDGVGRLARRPEPVEWYFFKADSDAGLKAGPFSWERMLVQAKNGNLEPNDVVWDPGSGWKTAAQVSGLFPDLPPAPVVESTFSDVPPPEPPSERKNRTRWDWIVAVVVLLLLGVALGVYFGVTRGDDDGMDNGVSVNTTLSGTPAGSTSTSESTTTTDEAPSTTVSTTADAVEPVASLNKGDSGHEVKLRVGDRVRVDLEPWAGDSITYVFWKFRPSDPVVVRVVDSGAEIIDGVVVTAWLELEATVAGPATVRALYEYPDGSTQAKWVAYLIVNE